MIVIQTALPVEQQAVLEHLVDLEVHRHPHGTLFDVGSLAGQPSRRIALGVTGPGTQTAAALTERAIAEFSPTAIMFVGVAGGRRSWLEIGDVVVASKVYSYHGGRSEDDDFLVRPRAWEISHELEQAAKRLPRGNTWYSRLPAASAGLSPQVHFEAIAVGDVVVNSTTSSLAKLIHHHYNDAIAVEMEGSGFAQAAHLSGQVPWVVIRAISDHADGSKEVTDSQGGQGVAARHAAAFAVALAAALDDRHDDNPGRQPGRAGSPPPPAVQHTNVAHSGAQVGHQVGTHVGNSSVTFTGERR